MWSINSVTLIIRISTHGTLPGTILAGNLTTGGTRCTKHRFIKDPSKIKVSLLSNGLCDHHISKGYQFSFSRSDCMIKKAYRARRRGEGSFLVTFDRYSWIVSSVHLRGSALSIHVKIQNSWHQLVFGSYRKLLEKVNTPRSIHRKSSAVK